MNKKFILLSAAGIALGLLIAAAIIGSSANGPWFGLIGMRQSTSMMNGGIDRHFIEQMVPHHEDAVFMANLALQKAEHPEIKTLAGNIVDTQLREIGEMRQWYKDWFGTDVPEFSRNPGVGMMGGEMSGSNSNLKSLESAQPFDKAFIEQMIPHHQRAIMMAQMLKNSTQRPEMRKLADDIIASQSKEIEQMRSWYGQWYR